MAGNRNRKNPERHFMEYRGWYFTEHVDSAESVRRFGTKLYAFYGGEKLTQAQIKERVIMMERAGWEPPPAMEEQPRSV